MDQTNARSSYDVFLSYRHKPRDNKICKRAHTILETFKPPRRHKQADIKRVFRDDEELPVAGVLSDTIGQALTNAKVLLVVCSTATPESQWVDREVRTFIELGRTDKIFALLIEGDAASSFPPSLKLVPGIEGRTLKIRSGNERQAVKSLKKELLRVVAEATDTPYEPLRIAVKRRKLFRSILAGTALSILLFASGIYSLYQWSMASYYNLFAQREELMIHDVINSVIFDLTDAVEKMPGASNAMIKILSDNIEYLDRMIEIGGPSEKILTDKGNNYLNLAREYMVTGDNKECAAAAKEAVKIFEGLADDHPSSLITNRLAISYNLAGLYLQSMTEYDKAVGYLEKATAVYEELEETDSEKDYRVSRADCINSIAVCYYMKADYQQAADMFIKEIALLKKIYGKNLTIENEIKLADLTSSVGTCLLNAHEYEKAEPYNYDASMMYEEIYKKTSETKDYKSYVVSLYSLGTNLAFVKDDEKAEYYLRLSLVEADKLAREKLPEFDATYLGMYAMYDLLYAGEEKKEEALSLAGQAYEKNPQDIFIRSIYGLSLLFGGYYEEALVELQSLIEGGQVKVEDIEWDLKLFSLRGRPSPDAERLLDSLASD